MKEYSFKKIDAFATKNSEGNPAAGVYLSKTTDISEQEMQQIAKELKGFVSEVGYIAPYDDNSYSLRYYSSEREVDFCGHATVGIMYDLIRNDSKFIDQRYINIVTSKGTLRVENRIQQEDAVFITAPDPTVKPVKLANDDIAEALNVSSVIIDSGYPVSVINAGLDTLLVPLRHLDDILSMSPNEADLKRFCLANGIDIVTVFCPEVFDHSNAFRTRVFAPKFGYLEDPATGSGNAAFGYYLIRQKEWDGSMIAIEQNGNKDSPNIIKLKAQSDEQNKLRVVFGGGAIVRIEGEYLLAGQNK